MLSTCNFNILRGTRVLLVDIICSEHCFVSQLCHRTGSFVTIPVFVLPYCIKYSHIISILPILTKFLSQSLSIYKFTAHSLQFIDNCPRPVGVDFILLSISTVLFQARLTLLVEPQCSYPESLHSFAEPLRSYSPEPLCSLFHSTRLVQLEPLRSSCI